MTKPRDLAALGLIPDPANNPDAELLAALERQGELRDEFRHYQSTGKWKRTHSEWGPEILTLSEKICRLEPHTILGMQAKGDDALRLWRDHTGPDRYKMMWAGMACCLEQAVAMLAALKEVSDMNEGRP